VVRITIPQALAGQRLDKALVAALGTIGRAGARALFEEGRVRIVGADGRARRARKADPAPHGAVVEIDIEPGALERGAPADPSLALPIALERPDLVIVDKPAGVPSAPVRAGERGTVASALVARYPEMAAIGLSPREPGLCHRLDTGTSGLLLAARSTLAFEHLVGALRSEALDKRYLCVCEDAARALAPEAEIAIPLATPTRGAARVRACVDPRDAARLRAREAVTRYRILERRATLALVEASAPRAHRHQLRAHFAAVGAPLAGDTLYGAAPRALGRQALHASELAWRGDAEVRPFHVRSPLPEDIEALLASE
jgi:23S rRNA pseudouridine1911/1915/1917 synthase